MLRKTFVIHCPQGHSLTVSSFHAGQQVPCPTCHVLVVVPEPHMVEPAPRTPSYGSAGGGPRVSLADEHEGGFLPAENHLALARVRTGLGFFLGEIILWALGVTAIFGTVMAVAMGE